MEPRIRVALDELHAALAALYGPRLVALVLYGSRARGDAAPDSDIDVLVVLRGPVVASEEIRRTGGIVADISLRHDCVVQCAFVDETRYRREGSPFLINVRREGVPV